MNKLYSTKQIGQNDGYFSGADLTSYCMGGNKLTCDENGFFQSVTSIDIIFTN